MTDRQNFDEDDDIPNYIDWETVQQMLRESAMQKDVSDTQQNPAREVEESINEKQYIDMDSVRNLLENYKTLSKTSNNDNPSTADVIDRPADVISQSSAAPTVSAVVVIGDNDDLSQPIYAKVNKRSSMVSTEPSDSTLLRTPLPTVPEVKKERPKTFPKPPKLPPTQASTTVIVVSASRGQEVAETSDDPTYDAISSNSAMDSPSIENAAKLTVNEKEATAKGNDLDDEDDTYASISDFDGSKQGDDSQQQQQHEEKKENGDDQVETPYATYRVHSARVDPSTPTQESLSASSTQAMQSDDVIVLRFVVRSIGSVEILESDLVPTRSTPAVIECVTTLITSNSRSTHSNWPTDKDLYLELRDANLNIADPANSAVLSSQSLSTIRKWGSHPHAKSRYFAYVSRDRPPAGNRFKCHVFQTESADQITTALREICWKIAAKKKQNGSNTTLPRVKSEPMT